MTLLLLGSPPQTSEAFAVGRGGAKEWNAVFTSGGNGVEWISPRRGAARGHSNQPFRLKTAPPPAGQGPAVPGGRTASIAQMYILRACRGTSPDPYAACGRKFSGDPAGAQRSGSGGERRKEWSGRSPRRQAGTQQSGISFDDGLGPEKGGENAGWHFTPA